LLHNEKEAQTNGKSYERLPKFSKEESNHSINTHRQKSSNLIRQQAGVKNLKV